MPSEACTLKSDMFPYPSSKRKSFAAITGFVSLVLSLAGCGGGAPNVVPPPPTSGQTNPQFGRVFIVVEENASYADVIGSSSMPYFDSLANTYGLATNYYANLHPSIPNYFEMTVGKTETIIDGETPQSFPVSDDNVVRELITAGKSWKSYAEDLPNAGYTGGDTGNYLVRHNPLAYMTDVQNTPRKRKIWCPFPNSPRIFPPPTFPNIP